MAEAPAFIPSPALAATEEEEKGLAVPTEQPPAFIPSAPEPVAAEPAAFIPSPVEDAPAFIPSPEEQEEVGIGEGIGLGIQRSLAPWTMDKEDLLKIRSFEGMASEIISNIVTDIATTTATGAAIGSVVPGVGTVAGGAISLVGWAVYRGLGNEYIAAEVKGRDFDPAKASLSVLVEANPLHRFGTGVAGKIAQGTRQMALQLGEAEAQGFLRDEQTGELNKMIAGGAILGGAATGLLPASQVLESRRSRRAKDMLDISEINTRSTPSGENFKQDQDVIDLLEKGLEGDLGKRIDEVFDEVQSHHFNLNDPRYSKDYILDVVENGKPTIKIEGSPEELVQRYGLDYRVSSEVTEVVEDVYGTVLIPRIMKMADDTRRPSNLDDIQAAMIGKIERERDEFVDWAIGNIAKNKKTAKGKGDTKYEQFKNMYAQYGQKEIDGEMKSVLEIDYANFVGQKAKVGALKKLVRESDADVDKLSDPVHYFSKFADHLMLGKRVDEVLGVTNFRRAVELAAQAENRVASKAAPYLVESTEIIKDMRKVGLKPTDLRKIIEGGDDAKKALKANQRVEVERFETLLETARRDLNDQGLNISKLDASGYFMHTSAQPYEIARRLRKAVTQFEDKAGDVSADRMRHMFDVVQRVTKRPVKTLDQVKQRLDEIATMSPDKMRQNMVGSHGFERKGLLSEFELENDPGRAFQKYVTTMLRSVHFKEAMQEAQSSINMLVGAQGKTDRFEKTINHWTDWYNRMNGTETGKFHAASQIRTQSWKNKMVKLIDDPERNRLVRNAAKAGFHVPEFMGYLTSFAYSNLLGWNVRAPLRNTTQTWFLTAPEIAADKTLQHYGWGVVRKAWGETTDRARAGTYKALQKDLDDLGYRGGQFIGEASDMLSDSLASIPYLGRGFRFGEAASQWGMSLYSMSDDINRHVTLNASKILAREMLEGVAGAKNFYQKADASLRRDALRAMKLPSERRLQALEKITADYMISKSQFLYNKASLSAFGQEYGKLVSMFSKWPVMITNDIKNLYQQRRFAHAAIKYATPSILLWSLSEAADQAGAYDEGSVGKLLLGSSKEATRGYSTLSAATGVSIPPIIQSGTDLIRAGAEIVSGRDPEVALQRAIDSVMPFIPGGVPLEKGIDSYNEFIK